MSRPVDGRRRVLGSTSSTPTTPVPTTSSRPVAPTRKPSTPNLNKPLKARVDPSQFAQSTPPPPPIGRSPSVASGAGGYHLPPKSANSSAPPTPQTAHFSRATTPSSSSSFSSSWNLSQRPPSPARTVLRANRSPDGTSGVSAAGGPKMGEGVGRAGHEAFGAALRGALVKGQQQEDYLPAGVSVRSANRSSPRASPASSSSLSTGLSSPITSPSLYSPVPFHDLASNGSFRPKSTTSSRPPTTSSNTSSSSTNRRASHGSSTAHPNPTVASEGLGLPAALTVPPSPTHSSLSFGSRSLSPLPLSTSPTFSDPSRPLRVARPPSVASNSFARPTTHRRSNSSAGSSVASSLPVSDDGYGSASRSAGKAREDPTIVPHPPLSPRIQRDPEAEERELRERRESDELEKEARVTRRVLDLEIRNASLLALNTTLEVTRLRQTREISDLRRRLRESRSLAPISASVPNEGLLSGSESDGEDDPDDPDHPDAEDEEAAWEDVLQHDAKFAQAAGLLEALVRRAKDALAFHPSAVGRVLNQAELLDTGDSSAAPSPAPASVAGDDDDSDED